MLFVTGQHFAGSARKVDLHFLADSLNAQGDRTDFLSLRLSQLSRFSHDGRWTYARSRTVNRWVRLDDLRDEFIWVNLVHPFATRSAALNRLTGLIFRHYAALLPRAVRDRLPAYTHILVESGIATLLTPLLRRLAPQAKLIYHAADQFETIGAHPCFRDAWEKSARQFDLIHILAETQRADMPEGVPVLFLPHGVAAEVFDGAVDTPYTAGNNAVSVGDMLFDAEVLKTLAHGNPDWTFHLFGKKSRLDETLPNVVTHGEVPFTSVASYIRHADIGIAPYRNAPGADYLSQSSLKMIQYTYCRLPIVAPIFAAAGRPHVLAYEPDNQASILAAFNAAKIYDRLSIDTSQAVTWQEMAVRLFV
ncbi:glycosyltransferase [Rhizobiaceae bacterium BDR2-2]|uniref:Glycosyltransferase n=1 Tax=Ectorhizobium quercum TaxID=2965071 RepID=A0AAE3N439_9HYPH|nr:glycosyltransferase [Ectorhizobium quercum]MCX8999627.1 glycosyltransferase [Ectorhizobium quercum]